MNLLSERHRHLADLIAATASADESAFGELHGLTHEYLYHLALQLLRSPSLAEEALQEAYLSIWLHAGSFRPGGGSPMTWLIAIVRHRALSLLRSSAWPLPPEAEQTTSDEVDTAAQMFDAVERDGLERALARLEAPQRQSIALAYGRDMTHAEVARHLGVPLGTAKSWLRRGLERLRGCLAPRDPAAVTLPLPMLAASPP